MEGTALPEVAFTAAKTGLSTIMDEVVHDHRPKLVQRKGREEMLLVRPDDLARWLDTFRFPLAVTLGEGDVAVEVEGFGVVGIGDTTEAAIDDLADELEAYARRFFERPHFYLETDRARHYPWLLRFALAARAGSGVELLHDDIKFAAAQSQREVVASAA